MRSPVVTIVVGVLLAASPLIYRRQIRRMRARARDRGKADQFDQIEPYIRTWLRGVPVIGVLLVIVGILMLTSDGHG